MIKSNVSYRKLSGFSVSMILTTVIFLVLSLFLLNEAMINYAYNSSKDDLNAIEHTEGALSLMKEEAYEEVPELVNNIMSEIHMVDSMYYGLALSGKYKYLQRTDDSYDGDEDRKLALEKFRGKALVVAMRAMDFDPDLKQKCEADLESRHPHFYNDEERGYFGVLISIAKEIIFRPVDCRKYAA